MNTLKKFGPKCCDLPTMIWNMSLLLKVLTLDIDSRNKKGIPIIFYIVTAILIGSYLYVYFFSMIWFVFWRCSETGDILAALIILSLGLSSEIGTVKFVCMFYYSSKVKEIVAECLAYDLSMKPSSRFSKNLLSCLRDVKKRAIACWLVIAGNGVVYILKPILTPGRHMMEDHFILYGLEPMHETPNYQIAFLLSAAGVVFTCYPPASIQAFSIVISGYIEAQMLALTEEMVNLYRDAKDSYYDGTGNNSDDTGTDIAQRNRVMNKYIEKRLKEIAQSHARSINILKQLEHVFSGAIVVEFALLTSGLISELLGGLENTYIEVPFALMQVGMDCFTGQRVMDASERFEAAVYGCKWERFDNANMKLVLTMLQNAQKTMKLSAGGLATLSFQCFMTIIRYIYSAYTTLRTTMNNE